MKEEQYYMEYKEAKKILDFSDEASRDMVHMLDNRFGPYTNVDIRRLLNNLETQTMGYFYKYERLRKQFEKAEENYNVWVKNHAQS